MWVVVLLACGRGEVSVAQAPSPVPAGAERLRFVALGDAGRGTEGQARVARAVARTCQERGCDFVALLGDNLYPRGMESADDPRADELIAGPYRDAGAPLYLVLGNHDYAHGRDRQRAAWQVAWAGRTAGVELPAHAWWARMGPALVVGLDTNAAFQFGAGFQREWLREMLEASDAPFRVVLGHHPFRSEGRHGNAGAYEGWSGVPILSGAGLQGLFEDTLCGRADLYLSGHDHNRQLLERCGVDLVVSGAGGSTTPLEERGNERRFAEPTLGLVWVGLSATSGEVVFLDADGQEEASFSLAP
jgi:tartrate-resistant acid phosphatase type 5